jgi:hypothetical protein
LKEEPDLETEGQRPPRDSLNSKNVSMTVMTFLDAPDEGFFRDDPDDFEDTERDADAVVVALDSDWTAFPPPLPFPLERTTLDDALAADVVVDEPFEPLPPFPLFPVALAVELEDEATVAEVATDEALLSATSGPAATALAAKAAASTPFAPVFDWALAVLPDPMTVNFVQSSAVPRWATGMSTGWWLAAAAMVHTR